METQKRRTSKRQQGGFGRGRQEEKLHRVQGLGFRVCCLILLQGLFSVPRFSEKFLRLYNPLICCQGLPSSSATGGGPSKSLSLQLGALAVALQTRRVRLQKALGLHLLQQTLQRQNVQIDEAQLLKGQISLSLCL